MNPRLLAQMLILSLVPLSAHAYIDPGSGMLLWQGLIAAIGFVLVFLRRPWQTIKDLISRFTKRR